MATCGTTAGYFVHRRAGEETCEACRIAMRAHVSKYRPPVERLPCIGCGTPIRKSADGRAGTCRACRNTPMSARMREAKAAARKAAKGTRSRWIWTAGPCSWCSEEFTARAARPVRFCSKRCAQAQKMATRGRFKIRPSVRLGIYERDGWTCQLCDEPVDRDLMTLDPSGDWAPTLDHIVPQSKGGTHDTENLRLAHRWCNSVRGDESYYSATDLRRAA